MDDSQPISSPPRRPSVSLFTWVLLLGVTPTWFVIHFVRNVRLDGGFYMPPEFLDAQREMIMQWGYLLGIPTALMAFLVLRRLIRDDDNRFGHMVLLALLAVTLGRNVIFTQDTYQWFQPAMTEAEVLEYAQSHIDPSAQFPFPRDVRFQNRVFTVGYRVPVLADAQLPTEQVLPGVCRALGRLFNGPVDGVELEFSGPLETRSVVQISRGMCRNWYLSNRAYRNRPNDILPEWKRPENFVAPITEA